MPPSRPALCDQCQQQPATVFLTQCIIGGGTIQRQLCPACAAPIIESFPPTPLDLPTDQVTGWLDQIIDEPTKELPKEVTLPETITVEELAAVLHVKTFRVIAALIHQHLFSYAKKSLSFEVAARVCQRLGVKAHRLD